MTDRQKVERVLGLWVAAAVCLAGCATASTPRPYRSPTSMNPTPVCSSDRQCDAMWLTARENLELVTRMRVRTQTPTVMETYFPTDAGRMYGVVTKFPMPDGTWQIRLSLECKRNVPCNDGIPEDGTSIFNGIVSASGVGYK